MASNGTNGAAHQLKNLDSVKNKALLHYAGYINGEWIEKAHSGKTFDVVDPATLEKLATVPEMDKRETAEAVQAAHDAFKSFKKTTARERARMMRKWYDLNMENVDDLALILCLENGKTLTEAKGEVAYSASFLEWFAGEAERVSGQTIPPGNPAVRIMTMKQPIGVAACLAPWNFPIAMITRKCGAALAAGCTTVWKPAGETPLSAIAQAVLATQAGFPKGSINLITTLNTVSEVGEELCTNKLVKKLSFTGSTRVGKILMKQCASSVKKLSLELGGNSPLIIFDDAKISNAINATIAAKFRNAGQTCVSANRVFVQSGIYDKYSEALVEAIKKQKVGLGTEEGVTVGPLTHERAVDKAMTHINDAKKGGAKVILGGEPMKEKPGYFLQPTILSGMSKNSINWSEETFAPVVALYKFETEDEVLELANDADVGLGSYVITEDIGRMYRISEGLEVGMVGVNSGILSAAESPFGGVKESGFGREGGREGIEEYVFTKSVVINIAG
ncbi:succinate-semialdehyde dehydrogenase [Rhizodiscina lignyota]|uniref:succinate-semialdehyde dehydrogenase [NAD(P)(+)] n=1 Tax=Rhizodiscina lignyota TaxID=1504668 RepID=A0A9P4M4J9_9PEZI|nr:succinate-semialdehyde dehydrogenase [Rhizodiscina lignyota]